MPTREPKSHGHLGTIVTRFGDSILSGRKGHTASSNYFARVTTEGHKRHGIVFPDVNIRWENDMTFMIVPRYRGRKRSATMRLEVTHVDTTPRSHIIVHTSPEGKSTTPVHWKLAKYKNWPDM